MSRSIDSRARLEGLFTYVPPPDVGDGISEFALPPEVFKVGKDGGQDIDKNLFRAAFEIISIGMILISLDGSLLRVNDVFCAMVGCAPDELEGFNFQIFIHPDDLPRGMEALRAILSGQSRTTCLQLRWRHGDGHFVWLELNSTLIRDSLGNPPKIITVAQEISMQDNNSELLQKRLRELNCLNDIGYKIDERPYLPELFEWIVTRVPEAIQDPEKCRVAIEYAGMVYGEPETLNYQNKVVGEIKVAGELLGWLHIAYIEPGFFLDEERALVGNIVSRLSSYIETIMLLETSQNSLVELHRSEEVLAKRAKELAIVAEQTQKSAVELQAVAEVATATSRLLDPNRLLQEVVDLSKDHFGLYHAHIYLVDETDNNLILCVGSGEVGQKMCAEGWSIPIKHNESMVARVARERRGHIIVDVRGEKGFLPNPVLPETLSELAVPMIIGNRLLGVLDVQSEVVNRFTESDVDTFTTLASQVAVALQNANLYAEQHATVERLRELDHMKSAFLANMSHELRTPLNSILGFAQVLLEGLDGPLTDIMASDLELIEKSGRHLLNLINDVLDMAKIEAGRLILNPEELNLYEMIEEVIVSSGPLAREKNLYMRLEAEPEGDWNVMADHIRLRQIFINLIGNSIKFTEKGGISIGFDRVWPISENEQGRIRVWIRDSGVGIPPEKLEEIFEAFSQVDTSTTRKVGGTGLGLPISRRLVELLGGRLWAESSGIYGEGAVFYLELPKV